MHQMHSHLFHRILRMFSRNNLSSLLCQLLFLVPAFASQSCQSLMHAATLCLLEKNILYQAPMATPHCSSSSTGMLLFPGSCTPRAALKNYRAHPANIQPS